MKITLRDIDTNNWTECIDLKVGKEQEKFLPVQNVESIAEWKFNPHWRALGIYCGDEIVGFAMYGVDLEDDTMCLFKFMIDEKYQGKGYGKDALQLVLKEIQDTCNYKETWVSFHPESEVAYRLYTNFGFKQRINGLEDEDEVFYVLEY